MVPKEDPMGPAPAPLDWQSEYAGYPLLDKYARRIDGQDSPSIAPRRIKSYRHSASLPCAARVVSAGTEAPSTAQSRTCDTNHLLRRIGDRDLYRPRA